ncbi:3-hydroxybutyrate oligomer hydrolase family protein [Neptunomonas antarctica]|uniref:Hydroxybutyrate-dimer hydrolase n=1 Tax=Neptunomonas antarctica TaxID=619304 RepID=A0A1N7IYZ6_9GAMM|nr:3-hydroxybutyrate oligomer hydrolase family protein [Neptunomonas antarctica]SIS42274.1 hydroxybutyrate-dimer hydrolase [Neptunomonas antarctica]
MKRIMTPWIGRSAPVIGLCVVLSGCNSSSLITTATTGIPFTLGEVVSNYYDGKTDGLLGGFGLSGFQTPPAGFYADAANPSAAELRRHNIYLSYTGLVDQSDTGGFGRLYGPMDDTTYAGYEYLAYVGKGINRAIVMVQVPDSFDVNNPCIIAAPSSGSRGVYGAMATAGAWGLKKGCAVAYTDANKGTGAVDLSQMKSYGLQMQAKDLATTDELTFRVPTQESVSMALGDDEYAGVTLPTDTALDNYIAAKPNRYAFKHAHSQKNSEKDWGLHTLQAVKFALQQLSTQFDQPFSADNTLVIAASVSNGGAAALKAAEADTESLIDAVVVGEPNINPATATQSFGIKMGANPLFTAHSKPAYEYFVIAEMYAACASKAVSNTGALFSELRGPVNARCDALVAAGYLQKGSYEEQGAEAREKLNAAGYLPDSDKLLVGYAGVDLFQSLLATYGNAYSRSSVVDNLCNISMAHVATGTVVPAINDTYQTLAAISSGIPRTANIFLIKDDALGGPTLQFAATSANGNADYNFEGAKCWYDLFYNSENSLNTRLMAGIEQIKGNGNLQHKPTIIVHGRSDALIPVNHSSRPYLALNQQVEGAQSQLKYYEITNAQHLDALNQLYASLGMSYVPLDYYFKQALDLMYDHLENATALPPSQVVRAQGRAGALQVANLPAISATAIDTITFDAGNLVIPE